LMTPGSPGSHEPRATSHELVRHVHNKLLPCFELSSGILCQQHRRQQLRDAGEVEGRERFRRGIFRHLAMQWTAIRSCWVQDSGVSADVPSWSHLPNSVVLIAVKPWFSPPSVLKPEGARNTGALPISHFDPVGTQESMIWLLVLELIVHSRTLPSFLPTRVNVVTKHACYRALILTILPS
jgi:hypothetical protein